VNMSTCCEALLLDLINAHTMSTFSNGCLLCSSQRCTAFENNKTWVVSDRPAAFDIERDDVFPRLETVWYEQHELTRRS
jgi:hypothetical protein